MLACIIMIYGSNINSDIPCIQNLYFNNTSQKIFKPFSVNLISISFTNCISLPVYIHAYEIKSACFLERFLFKYISPSKDIHNFLKNLSCVFRVLLHTFTNSKMHICQRYYKAMQVSGAVINIFSSHVVSANEL